MAKGTGGRRIAKFLPLFRLILSGILEIAGISSIVWAGFLVSPVLGFVLLGISGILVGLAIDPPTPRSKKREEE